jgi:hypothetical protein
MRTYQQTAFTVLGRYDILQGGHKGDAGVGSGRRRRFLDFCGFRFSTTLCKVFFKRNERFRCVSGSTDGPLNV